VGVGRRECGTSRRQGYEGHQRVRRLRIYQRRLLAQLADLLHALGGADCTCSSSKSSPALSESALLPRAFPPSSPRPNLAAERTNDAAENACVIRAIERAVFPPPPAAHPQHLLHHADDADLEIDIDGDGGSVPASTYPPHPTQTKIKPRRLTRPGVSAAQSRILRLHRSGRLVGGSAERGISAVERVRGGGRWGGLELMGGRWRYAGKVGCDAGRERVHTVLERRPEWDIEVPVTWRQRLAQTQRAAGGTPNRRTGTRRYRNFRGRW
jgi:hypothetical protein